MTIVLRVVVVLLYLRRIFRACVEDGAISGSCLVLEVEVRVRGLDEKVSVMAPKCLPFCPAVHCASIRCCSCACVPVCLKCIMLHDSGSTTLSLLTQTCRYCLRQCRHVAWLWWYGVELQASQLVKPSMR